MAQLAFISLPLKDLKRVLGTNGGMTVTPLT